MDSFVVEAWISDIAMAEGLTRSASSFPTALASRPAFSAQSPSQTSSYSDVAPRSRSTSPTKPCSRSTSPTKRFQKTESLLGLAVPIQFIKKQTLGAAITDDARPLLEALAAVEAGEALLPAVLRSHSDFQNDPRQHSYDFRRQFTRVATDTLFYGDDTIVEDPGIAIMEAGY